MRKLFEPRIAAKRIEIRIEPQQCRGNRVLIWSVQQMCPYGNRNVFLTKTRCDLRLRVFIGRTNPGVFRCWLQADRLLDIFHRELAVSETSIALSECVLPVSVITWLLL